MLIFGVVPNSGAIRGSIFLDENANATRESQEPALTDYLVFLDLNDNNRLDRNEPIAETDLFGNYEFSDVTPLREYTVAIQQQSASAENVSRSQVLPRVDEFNPTGTYHVFVSAAGIVDRLDFGFREDETTGQNIGIASGRVFIESIDGQLGGLVGVNVYVDTNENGVRDLNEVQVVTSGDNPNTEADESGSYEIRVSGNRTSVRLNLNDDLRQTSPISVNSDITTFTPNTSDNNLALLSDVSDALIVDSNSDGLSELFLTRPSNNTISVHSFDVNGLISTDAVTKKIGQAIGPIGLAEGRHEDGQFAFVAVASRDTNEVLIFTDLNLAGAVSPKRVSVAHKAVDIEVADINHDGKADLLVLAQKTHGVMVLLQNDQGEFEPKDTFAVGGHIPGHLVVGNFDSDPEGNFDIAVTNRESVPGDEGNIRILIGDGTGGFELSPQVLTAKKNPDSIASADFNNDSHLDLAVTNRSSQSISVFLGRNDGTFEPHTQTLGAGRVPFKVSAIDIDNDGDVDLVSTGGGDNPSISVIRNKLDSSVPPNELFAAQEQSPLGQFERLDFVTFANGDLDDNGIQDLVIANGDSDELQIRLNRLQPGPQSISLVGQSQLTTGIDFVVATRLSKTRLAVRDNEVIELKSEDPRQLDLLSVIDLRSHLSNTLMLDSPTVAGLSGGSLDVYTNKDDTVNFDSDQPWEFTTFEVQDGVVFRTFEVNGARVRLSGPHDLTNPLKQYDVNHDGRVTAADALSIVNKLVLSPPPLNDGKIDPANSTVGYAFWDTNQDNVVTASDALVVINQLNLNRTASSAQSELVVAPDVSFFEKRKQQVANELRLNVPYDVAVKIADKTETVIEDVVSSQQHRKEAVIEPSRSADKNRTTEGLDQRDELFGDWDWIDFD